MLRIVNAALNFQLYLAVANHSLTVVEIDGEYTQPLTTDVILIAPGQTTNVIITYKNSTSASPPPGSQFYVAASVYSAPSTTLVPFPATPTTAILRYSQSSNATSSTTTSSTLQVPSFPAANDTNFEFNFSRSLRSLTNYTTSRKVPTTVDLDVLHTIGYNLQPCPPGVNPNVSCTAPNSTYFRTSVNNITFVDPSDFSILEAYYKSINANYTTDFPDVPAFQYNYTAVDPVDKAALAGTKVRVVSFNTSVQVVYQDTATLFFESHPMHLHGHSFFIVGYGNGTYDPNTDPASFNLVDPPLRNTVGVPPGGWAAVRFLTDNPGVWFVHCHFDIHQSWGMNMAFVTLNGNGPSQTLPPPPSDLPAC